MSKAGEKYWLRIREKGALKFILLDGMLKSGSKLFLLLTIGYVVLDLDGMQKSGIARSIMETAIFCAIVGLSANVIAYTLGAFLYKSKNESNLK